MKRLSCPAQPVNTYIHTKSNRCHITISADRKFLIHGQEHYLVQNRSPAFPLESRDSFTTPLVYLWQTLEGAGWHDQRHVQV